MIGGLFKPLKQKDKIHHFLIGKQNLIVIELFNKNNYIIINKLVENLLIKYSNLYFFATFKEMEIQLDDLITSTNENFIVIIG